MVKRRPKLVADWRRAHRWISMRAAAVNAAVLTAWLAMPDDLKSHIPPLLLPGIALALLVLGAVGRLIDQEPK